MATTELADSLTGQTPHPVSDEGARADVRSFFAFARRGPGIENVIAALAFLNIPFFLRVTRGAVLQVRERPFVEAARCVGNSEMRVAFAHVMPNALTPALANISPGIGFSILLTSGLSFV